MFKIDALDLHWIDNSLDCPGDLCLHARIVAQIGTEVFEDDLTASAAALYLLRTLTEERIIHTANPILPCCGHFMLANDTLDAVEIIGCPNGIDWSVEHDSGIIKITTEAGVLTFIDAVEYKTEVYRFADKIEDFYKNCSPKTPDEHSEKGYLAFWHEWHRRRQ